MVVWHQTTIFFFLKKFNKFSAIWCYKIEKIKSNLKIKIKNADVENYEEVNQKSKVSVIYIYIMNLGIENYWYLVLL